MSTISPKESQNKIDTPINEKNNLDLGNFISEKKLPPKESTKVGSTWNGLEDK